MSFTVSLIFNSCFLAILFILILGIIYPKPFYSSSIKFAFLISLFPSVLILANHLVVNSKTYIWVSSNVFSLSLDFRYDLYSVVFTSIALYITYNIVSFSQYYMSSDQNIHNFTRLLNIFLLAMIVLISANNAFQLLIGWEGVGFLSFLLIGWWFTRFDANTRALQAIIYNRIGDIGILLAAGWLLTTTSSWKFDSLFVLCNTSSFDSSLFLWGCLLAATGKSAQFGLHPWLPAAMEGPTPVSALLHRSTMVVAGIFLLIRISPLLDLNPLFRQAALLLGAVTAFFAASCAITQHDIKKIVAFSTTSQLGLMMVSIGLSLPTVAFFHICTHGFFKAMLFLCSGSVIHNSSDEQDLRKNRGLAFNLPVTSACLTLGRMALTGVPFLAGFYSKDLIFELALLSPANFIGISLAVIATTLTATYRARIILYSFSNVVSVNPLTPTSEESLYLTTPIKNLAVGATLVGWALRPLIYLSSPLPLTLPLKTITIIIAILGFSLAIYSSKKTIVSMPFRGFFTSLWYFSNIFHHTNSFSTLSSRYNLLTRLADFGWSERMGAQGLSTRTTSLSKKTQLTQRGLIKQYIAISLLTFLPLLLILSF